MGTSAYRTYGIAIALALFVAMAGCSAPFQAGDAPGQNSSTEMSDETTTATTTERTETDAEEESTAGAATADQAGEEITGRMLLVVDGSDRHVDQSTSETDDVWINESQPHRWHVANESTTLAAALAAFDVEATSDSLTYANETYDESTNGTTVAYRVDGTVVEDPTSYEIEDGDEVFVTVYTSNLTTPGREYSTHHPHAHGTLEATIEGEEVNFTHERYAMNDDYFHFHGDEAASRWHAHSTNLTASYAISSFDDLDVTNGSVTYSGTTYDDDRTTITVNGEPVDRAAYVLKDGDDVELVVNETG